jgi:hypothetical protein
MIGVDRRGRRSSKIGGVYDIMAQGIKGLIRILILISGNFLSGRPLPETPKLSVLVLEQ